MNEQELIQVTIARVVFLRSQGRLLPLAHNGYKLAGRGAIVVNAGAYGLVYWSRGELAARLEGERCEHCLQAVDTYDPIAEAIVIGCEKLSDDREHTHITTLLIKL